MAYTKQLLYEARRSLSSGSITGTYQALGGPLLHPASLIKLINDSDQSVDISVDGSTDVDVAPANSFWLYDVTSNTPTHGDDAIFIPQNTQFYVKGTAGTGTIYLIVQYIVQV